MGRDGRGGSGPDQLQQAKRLDYKLGLSEALTPMRTFPTLALVLLLFRAPGFAQTATPDPVPAAAELLQAPVGAELTASGLATQVLRMGRGTERPGAKDYVTVQYTLWNPDGEVVASTVGNDWPLVLPVARIMKGLGEGLQLMTAGERRRMWVPAGLGFPKGRLWSGRLILDVELLAVDPPPSQAPADLLQPPADAIRLRSGLVYRVLRQGVGSTHPDRGCHVTVNYTGWTTDGKMFDSTVTSGGPSAFRLGEVIKGWTEGLRLMVKGDKLRLWIPEKLAYQGAPRMPAGTLVFDVELLAIWP